MRATIPLALALALLLLGCGGPRPTGRAEFRSADGKDVGVAVLTTVPDGVSIEARFHDLPPGVHALHIHEVGSCEPPEFSSAGPHFNPLARQHGRKNPAGPHLGDLPDVIVEDDGTSRYGTVVGFVALVGDEALSLTHGDGTAIVIHAEPDDQQTDPAGNAGKRIACGVIRRQ